MANPDARQTVGFITDRNGRQISILTDYGDLLLDAGLSGEWRLSPAHVVQLEWLLSTGREQADQREAARLDREAE